MSVTNENNNRQSSEMQLQKTIELVTPFKDKMFRYAYNVVKDQFLAEDIVQESLIKIWKKREQFLEIENKEAWCITIARNLAIDKLRANKKRRSSDITEHYDISDEHANPAKKAADKDMLDKVNEIMDQLPEHQREIVSLRDIEGYTYKEIADIMGYTVDQVKVNLHRARKTLRDQLSHLRKAYNL